MPCCGTVLGSLPAKDNPFWQKDKGVLHRLHITVQKNIDMSSGISSRTLIKCWEHVPSRTHSFGCFKISL